MEEELVDKNYFWRTMIKLLSTNNKKKYTISQIASHLQLSVTSPYFQKLISYLIDKNFIIVDKIIGRTRLVNINTKQLAQYLRGSKDFDYAVKLIEFTNPAYII